MSQAQRNTEQSARVRSVPPPLPRRSGIAPAGTAAQASNKPRSTPPPPPLAAMRVSQPPRLSAPPPVSSIAPISVPVQLALLPQWDDSSAPLRPAPKQSKHLLYWIGSAGVSIAVGALVAAGMMSVRPGDIAQILPSGQSTITQAAPVQIAPELPVQRIEVEGLEIHADVAPVARPVVMTELTVTSEPSLKPAKRAKPATRATRRSQRSSVASVLTAAQPDPRLEAKAEADGVTEDAAPVVDTEVDTTATSASTEPQQAEATQASEPAAPEVTEPAAPALPEKLTRDQVRNGLDAKRSQVLACAKGTYGRVLADVTISSAGRVSNAVIEGTFAGTNAGSCMALALRGAQFPAFSGEDISVRYPFSF